MSKLDLLEDDDQCRWFLKYDGSAWHEVTKEDWVRAERVAGFVNTMGRPLEPATGGFGGRGVKGSYVDLRYAKPEQYNWDPDFRNAVWPPENGTLGFMRDLGLTVDGFVELLARYNLTILQTGSTPPWMKKKEGAPNKGWLEWLDEARAGGEITEEQYQELVLDQEREWHDEA